MLDKKQRRMIMELFGQGRNVSEIAKEVGVSRASVYRVIQSDFEEDPELHALKKRLKKIELQKRIREVGAPLKTEDELANIKRIMDRIISKVQFLWGMTPEHKNYPQSCMYCGEELEYTEEKSEGFTIPGYRCHKCEKFFYLHR